MRKATLYPKTRQLTIYGYDSNNAIPLLLLVKLRDDEGVIESFSVRRARKGLTLILVLAEHEGWPALNLLERLAESVSRLTRSRFVHEPWRSGGPTDVDMALSLIAGAFHRPPSTPPFARSA